MRGIEVLAQSGGFGDDFKEWVGDGATSSLLYIGLVLAVIFIVMRATTR